MDSDYLNRCMERYWKRWESFARQQCFNRFILFEFHDVLMDALMDLLRQPESMIGDLIRDEKMGHSVILCWVYKAIINQAKIHRVECSKIHLCRDLGDFTANPVCEASGVSDSLFNSMRDVEACTREDDFIDPNVICYTGQGRFYRYVSCRKRENGERTPRIIYEAHTRSKQRRNFADKQKAMAFLNAGHQGGASKLNHQIQGYEKVS